MKNINKSDDLQTPSDVREFEKLEGKSLDLVAGGENGSGNGVPSCPKCLSNSNVGHDHGIKYLYPYWNSIYTCTACQIAFVETGYIIGPI